MKRKKPSAYNASSVVIVSSAVRREREEEKRKGVIASATNRAARLLLAISMSSNHQAEGSYAANRKPNWYCTPGSDMRLRSVNRGRMS